MMRSALGESTNDVDGDRELRYSHTEEEAPYEFSLDPETRAAEKRLRRVVAKQVEHKQAAARRNVSWERSSSPSNLDDAWVGKNLDAGVIVPPPNATQLLKLTTFVPCERSFLVEQARQGVDVEGVFRQYDPEESGSVLRSDFVQAVMQLGVSLLDSIAPR